MYKIITPNCENHKFTFILLHSMCTNENYFSEFLNYIKKKDSYKFIFNHIKFIFPVSPKIDIDYPNNKLFDQNAWYNYYTCYDGINKIDNIDHNQFQEQSERIVNIVNQEAIILNSESKLLS